MVHLRNKIRFQTHFSFCLLCALALLLLPFQWILAWLIASAVHELGHYISLKAFRINVTAISLQQSGIIMMTESIEPFAEAVCALAGPICGLFLLFVAQHAPHIAICGLMQSAFNLLPLYPLDGGRALQATISIIFDGPKSAATMLIIRRIVLATLFVLATYLFISYSRGYIGFIAYALVILKTNSIKFPCKHK